MFIIHIPFVVAGALGIFFFLPETQFNRPLGDMGSLQETMDELATTAELKEDAQVHHHETTDNALKKVDTTGSSTELKKTFIQELALFTGTYTETNVIKLLAAPLVSLLNPAVFWVSQTLTYALNDVLIVPINRLYLLADFAL
jgi:hypothetical protein